MAGHRRKLVLFCRLVKWSLAVVMLFLAISWLVIDKPYVDNFPVSPSFRDVHGRLVHVLRSSQDEWLLPVALEDMGPWLPKVAVAIEDRRFYYHPGVDPLSLTRAVFQNALSGRIISGASTISAQVVRLSRPRSRSFFAKYLEFFEALKLERELDKEQILELYLNRAPFGGNIRGVEAASRVYFNKRSRELSLGESTLLVALLRGPTLYRPNRRPALARARRDFLLGILESRGVITSQQAEDARDEPVSGTLFRLPARAGHAVQKIMSENRLVWNWGRTGSMGLELNLDLDRQDQLEMRLAQALENFPHRITGAGAIMDKQGRVLAYVGNARTHGPAYLVDCVQTFRSSGSTLKPFVYLAAFAEGRLYPASLMADTPLSFNGRAPRNYDGHYHGPVSAGRALSDSLNVPAVRALRMVGLKEATKTLETFGFTPIPGRSYGDSLVLGGLEVSLWQLLGAYGSLSAQSMVVPSLVPSVSEHKRPFSSEAAWLVNDSLVDDSRLPPGLKGDGLAFKTGTSHGFRDAWLAVYNPDYTVVLWLGDPLGQSHERLTGLGALGPAAVGLMRDLGGKSRWPGAPAGLQRFNACPVSGQPVGPDCPGSRSVWRLASRIISHPCRLHTHRQRQVVTLWPSELTGFMAGVEAAEGPGRARARITSPVSGAVIMLEQGGRLPLHSEGTRGSVHWFVDGQFFQASGPGRTPVWDLQSGPHLVSLVDGFNRTAKSEFTVLNRKVSDKTQVPVLSFQ